MNNFRLILQHRPGPEGQVRRTRQRSGTSQRLDYQVLLSSQLGPEASQGRCRLSRPLPSLRHRQPRRPAAICRRGPRGVTAPAIVVGRDV